MGNIKFYYFLLLKADQTITHQNMWLWHVGSARNWSLVISRNLHRPSGVKRGFWGRAWPCCHWCRAGSSPSQSQLFFLCFQESVYSGSVYALMEWWFKLSNYFLSIAAQIVGVILMWLKLRLSCWFLGGFADFSARGACNFFHPHILFGSLWMRKEQIVFGLDSEKETSWVVEEATVVFQASLLIQWWFRRFSLALQGHEMGSLKNILGLNKCSAVVQQVECAAMGCGHLFLLLGCTCFPTDCLENGSVGLYRVLGGEFIDDSLKIRGFK